MSQALITLSNIGVSFAERPTLRNIDLTIHEKEIVSLIGPNGAGKSTLVKVVLGIIKANQGSIERHAGLTVGYVPQRFNPSSSLPLRVIDLLKLDHPTTDFLEQILLETGTTHLLQRATQQLSGGERQRVLLARALLKRPSLLVLDEPMQGLDIQSETDLYAYVRTLPERYGCAVLMVSHDLQWVMQGTQRVICLNHHICCSGTPDSIQQHPEYKAIFGTERVFYQHHHDHCGHGDLPHTHVDQTPHMHPETPPDPSPYKGEDLRSSAAHPAHDGEVRGGMRS